MARKVEGRENATGAKNAKKRIGRNIAATRGRNTKGMTLTQLRASRQLTQVSLAEALNINQPAVSAMEKRSDIHVSTLRSYIAALGGKLKITAEFPEGGIQIEQFRL